MPDPTAPYDVLITGGAVLDGTGSAPRRADVGVLDGRIVHVGALDPARTAVTVLDATGLIITPGFIDLHSHADFSVLAMPDAEACLRQGVTTVVTGNCGLSPFPTAAGEAADGSGPGTLAGAQWTDLDAFAAAVDAARPAVNVAPLVGHGALRTAVTGAARTPAGPAELDAMRALLARAADQGVFGLSTGLIYAPGSFATTDEIVALATEAAGRGLLYATHMRDEGDRLVEAVEEAVAVAEASGVRLQISHLKAMGPANHGKVVTALGLIDAAAARGLDVACDVYPYTASSTRLTSRLPDWAMDGGPSALVERLADPAARERILDDLRPAVGRTFLPEGVVLAMLGPGRYSDRIGASIADIARDEGTEPAAAVLDVLAAHQGEVMIVNHAMAEADVETVLRHPDAAVASDGWVLHAPGDGHPHPRNFGTFARVLGRYVRERETLGLADAVRKMTQLPASRLPLPDRGTLAPGRIADLVVLDPERVADTATFADPWQYATGVRDVLVRGEFVLRDGAATGARPGRTLRR
ncbi:amidohydrolase family protein [Streptomyces sp. VRA16 Mangrove soil]|uniref:N-acyl-D-amino-acid deacylase family protein n=1 Tax=Streptomyces sp. VRA16 Mangrove soil TaxID=2817434 RepID=UPI001A9E333B|nr:amidohydrolase family protein [Streptomyces sp. VRA16 Mangrove soil]MBO1332837.1 amidohydrolase family protein [Streptomyces sp. VRA16 Mangrove soil]